MATSTIKMPEINKNNLKSAVDITSYTSTDYVFPSDGYLVLSATATQQTYIRGRVIAANNYNFDISSSYLNGNAGNALYVKKGMKYRTINNDNNGMAAFWGFSV